MIAWELDPDVRGLLDRIVRAVRGLGWSTAALALRDDTTQAMHPVAVSSADPDLEARLLARPEAWHAAGYLIVPLEIDGAEIGWLSVDRSGGGGHSSPADVQVLKIVADQAALALHQASLRREVARAAARQQVLSEIAHTIGQHLDMADLFAAITGQVRQVFNVRRASIVLRPDERPGGDLIVLDETRGAGGGAPVLTPLEDLAREHILAGREAYRVVADTLAEGAAPGEARLADAGVRSYASLPLVVWGEAVGALSLASDRPGTFHPADAGFLRSIADHVASAVWNALLYEREQHRRHTADALATLAQSVNSTLELDEVLELALERLGQVVAYDSASILLLEGRDLRITACHGFEHPDELVGKVFRMAEGNVSHQVLLSQRARVIADVQQEPDWGHTRDDIEGAHTIRAWIGVPLVVRGESIGILAIDKFVPGFFTPRDAEVASAFAMQIATAIHNARLFRDALEQRDRLSFILNDASDSVIVLDRSLRVWLLNPAAERYLGVQREAVLGRPVEALALPELARALDRARAGGQALSAEITGVDGTAFHASIAPVRHFGWVIVMQDVTPLKELDRLRTEWIAAVSHDLKNPIQVVQLGAVLLEMDGPLNARQRERLAVIQRSTEQLSDLVAGVLDLARLEAGPPIRFVPVDARALLQGARDEIEQLARKKNQRLILDLPARLPDLNGDAGLLRRAVSNLLANAIKYTAEQGTITLRARRERDRLVVAVIDTGQGIPAEALPHLFTRFYRVGGTDVEGSGLGLSIVKSIVEKHHGTVEVSSVPGEGSRFELRLPLARRSVPSVATHS